MRWIFFIGFFLSAGIIQAQFSPGDLSEAHKHLEGMSNCASCHEAGNRVPDVKCLDCHTEISTLINRSRGYHASADVQSKTCIDCHSEHHGRGFNSVRVDEEEFDHELTGYELEGEHGRIDCRECHQPTNIANADLRKRSETYLGLGSTCLSCHTDYHQGTLGSNCADCHNIESFRPAPKFDHEDSDYPLRGAHTQVDCIECHQKTTRFNQEFQEFTGLAHNQCLDCHKDEHEGKFGSNCLECHTINSWSQLKSNAAFDHNLTDFPLEGRHVNVECAECHTSGRYATPLQHARCDDCHDDYHRGNFGQKGLGKDCAECHNVNQAFTWTSYSLGEHNESEWPLEGAHMATPCYSCHKPEENSRWSFAMEDTRCVSCHDNVHEGFISDAYYPNQACEVCHTPDQWESVRFDHDETGWSLEGAHEVVDCKACHWVTEGGVEHQEFQGRSTDCASCHTNPHGNQFEKEGVTDCLRCHSLLNEWNIATFNHSSTEFPLDGKHANLECASCHKPEVDREGIERVVYKIESFECIDCHGSN